MKYEDLKNWEAKTELEKDVKSILLDGICSFCDEQFEEELEELLDDPHYGSTDEGAWMWDNFYSQVTKNDFIEKHRNEIDEIFNEPCEDDTLKSRVAFKNIVLKIYNDLKGIKS